MPMCKVVNDNVHPFKQEFKESVINIPAKGSVEMDRDDAVMFVGAFFAPKLDGNDQPDPRFFKMLRIEEGSKKADEPVEETFVCQRCKFVAKSQDELNSHIETEHAEDWADEDFKEKHAEETAKRGRGRPPGAKNKE